MQDDLELLSALRERPNGKTGFLPTRTWDTASLSALFVPVWFYKPEYLQRLDNSRTWPAGMAGRSCNIQPQTMWHQWKCLWNIISQVTRLVNDSQVAGSWAQTRQRHQKISRWKENNRNTHNFYTDLVIKEWKNED